MTIPEGKYASRLTEIMPRDLGDADGRGACGRTHLVGKSIRTDDHDLRIFKLCINRQVDIHREEN